MISVQYARALPRRGAGQDSPGCDVKRFNGTNQGRASIFLAVLISLYPLMAFSQVKDLVKFEIAKAHFRRGTAHFNSMQYLAAAEFFRKAVKEYPDYYTARDYLARSYRLAGFPDAALKEWEALSDIAPENPAIASKIEGLRFQGVPRGGKGDFSEYVLNATYRSAEYPRHRFTRPVDIAVDNGKNIYITSFRDGTLVKLDANGKAVFSTAIALDGRLFGIDYRGGKLAVSDFKKDRVYIITTAGNVLRSFGETGSGEGRFHGPEGLCFGPRGELYVVDSGNHRVQKFDAMGRFILEFGKRGSYEGELSKPTDVAVRGDRVYVTDTGNGRIAVFDDSGNFVANLSLDDASSPRGIAVKGDILMVSDETRGLLLFDPSSGVAVPFESLAKGEGASRLMASVTDRDGYLYCLDYGRSAVALYAPVQRSYSNVSVEITSVDLKSFPVVAFYVNVRNREGSPLYGLDASNFLITEDGAPITNLYTDYLKRLLPSASISLLVDRSEEAAGLHNDYPWAADFILTKMRKNDSIKVTNFHGDTWAGSDFDWSRRRTLRALKKTGYGGGKNLGKALYGAVGDLIPRLNRRGVVLLTDGRADDASFETYTVENVIGYARSHYIPIYIISFREPDPVLKDIAESTGGALYRPRQVDGMKSIYGKIKNSEEYRYVLVYPTFKLPAFRGWWSDVRIEVEHRGQKGVEWCGYFMP